MITPLSILLLIVSIIAGCATTQRPHQSIPPSPANAVPTLYGTGSGFIIHPSGYIVTAAHVVKDASHIAVKHQRHNHRKPFDLYDATVIAIDNENDLALLKIDAAALPTIRLGEAAHVRAGQTVWALGYPTRHPNETNPIITKGKIVAIDTPTSLRAFKTDVHVSPGSSGGPMVNDRGEVIGVVVSTASNITFQYGSVREKNDLSTAIPIHLAQSMIAPVLNLRPTDRGMGAILQEADINQSGSPAIVLVLWKVEGKSVAKRQAIVSQQLGFQALIQGNFDSAITEFNHAISSDDMNIEAYKGRAQAFLFQGRAMRAITDFGAALALNSQDSSVYAARGQAYYHAGHLEEALRDVDAAISINSNDAPAYLLRGRIYTRQGHITPALQNYDKAIAIDPANPSGYQTRGSLYLNHLGQRENACADWEKACALAACEHYASAVLAGQCEPLAL